MTDINHPKQDIFDTIINTGDEYYILPDDTIVDIINVDEYFENVLNAQRIRKE